jgi:hypothetical protein
MRRIISPSVIPFSSSGASCAFRVNAQVVADASGADDAETLRVALDWLGALEDRFDEDEGELDWTVDNVGRLRGIRHCVGALIWVAATHDLEIE